MNALLPDLSRLSTDMKRESDDMSEGPSTPATVEVKRTRSIPKWGPRESPEERVCELSGSYAARKLLSILKEKMRTNMLLPLKRVPCAYGFVFPRSQAKLSELLDNDANFERQHCMSLRGAEFSERLDLSKVKDLVSDYKTVWPDGQADKKDNGEWNLDDSIMQNVIDVVSKHKEVFLPMIHALVESGYATLPSSFELLYRFQSIRHKAAGVYHMDYNKYQTYADDGKMLEAWTKSGSRVLVTAACINMDQDAPEPVLWHDCGTKVALGVPTLKPSALNELMAVVVEEAGAEAPACPTGRVLQNKVTHHLMEATEFALIEYEKQGYTMQDAGIAEVTLENGVISDYNDTMFHKANTDVPPSYSRVFFAMGPQVTMARRGVQIYDEKYDRTHRVFIHPI